MKLEITIEPVKGPDAKDYLKVRVNDKGAKRFANHIGVRYGPFTPEQARNAMQLVYKSFVNLAQNFDVNYEKALAQVEVEQQQPVEVS